MNCLSILSILFLAGGVFCDDMADKSKRRESWINTKYISNILAVVCLLIAAAIVYFR